MNDERDLAAFATQLVYQDQVVGNSFEQLPGYVVDRVFDDQWRNTGFYAVGLLNLQAGKATIAIRGSQDRLDVVSNATLGVQQYLANRAPLIEYVGTHILAQQVTIAGHSLGGGLSQYLAYDSAREYPLFRRHLIVQTHNGLGGRVGIARIHGRFDRAVIEGVTFRNYRHPYDPVSRIGGQIGGIYTIAADPRQNGLFHAHSNQRFVASGEASPFAGARRSRDQRFAINKTIEQLGPELSAALRQIVDNDEPIAAFGRISQMISRLPPKERKSLLELATDVLPFRRLWARWFGGGR